MKARAEWLKKAMAEPYDAVILVSPRRARDSRLIGALFLAQRKSVLGMGKLIVFTMLLFGFGLMAFALSEVLLVSLVLSAALANIAIHGLDWELLIPLVIGSVPGTLLGARLAPRVPQSFIRRGIVIVLTMSGLALLFKAGLHPFGEGHDTLEAILVGAVGLAMLVLVPFLWGLIRKRSGLPMFGAPTVSEIESLGSGHKR